MEQWVSFLLPVYQGYVRAFLFSSSSNDNDEEGHFAHTCVLDYAPGRERERVGVFFCFLFLHWEMLR